MHFTRAEGSCVNFPVPLQAKVQAVAFLTQSLLYIAVTVTSWLADYVFIKTGRGTREKSGSQPPLTAPLHRLIPCCDR